MASSKVWEHFEGIMQAETSRRCKRLVWSAYSEELPVKSLLLEKGVINNIEDAICPCCGEANETTSHAFLLCEEVKPIWFASPLGLRVESLPNNVTVSQWIDQCCVGALDKKAMGMVCAIVWALWHKRNAWVLRKKKLDCTQVIEKAVLACTFISEEEDWSPPSHPYIKVNFGSFVNVYGTGMGVVFRDFLSKTLASGTVFLPRCLKEPKIAEALCYRWAIGLARELGYSDNVTTIFETDCHQLYTRWNELLTIPGESSVGEFESVVKDCINMMKMNGTQPWTLTLALRSMNKVAQDLATLACRHGQSQRVRIGKVPKEASTYLETHLIGN